MASAPDHSPPSVVALAAATGIVGLVTGYFIGQASSIGIFGGSKESESRLVGESDADEQTEGEEDHVDTSEELSTFADSKEECKLILVVRTDLGMSKGRSTEFLLLS